MYLPKNKALFLQALALFMLLHFFSRSILLPSIHMSVANRDTTLSDSSLSHMLSGLSLQSGTKLQSRVPHTATQVEWYYQGRPCPADMPDDVKMQKIWSGELVPKRQYRSPDAITFEQPGIPVMYMGQQTRPNEYRWYDIETMAEHLRSGNRNFKDPFNGVTLGHYHPSNLRPVLEEKLGPEIPPGLPDEEREQWVTPTRAERREMNRAVAQSNERIQQELKDLQITDIQIRLGEKIAEYSNTAWHSETQKGDDINEAMFCLAMGKEITEPLFFHGHEKGRASLLFSNVVIESLFEIFNIEVVFVELLRGRVVENSLAPRRRPALSDEPGRRVVPRIGNGVPSDSRALLRASDSDSLRGIDECETYRFATPYNRKAYSVRFTIHTTGKWSQKFWIRSIAYDEALFGRTLKEWPPAEEEQEVQAPRLRDYMESCLRNRDYFIQRFLPVTQPEDVQIMNETLRLLILFETFRTPMVFLRQKDRGQGSSTYYQLYKELLHILINALSQYRILFYGNRRFDLEGGRNTPDHIVTKYKILCLRAITSDGTPWNEYYLEQIQD